MSANPLELLSTYGRLDRPDAVPPSFPERRRRSRAQVHWPLVLFRKTESATVESVTLDLNSEGFYFLAPIPFRIGELLICTMKVPTHEPRGRGSERNLECQVRVLRVKSERDGKYGVACQIEDYHFAHAVSPDVLHANGE